MSQLKVNTIRHTGASSDAVTLASDGTATAKITNNLSNRNLVINGDFSINQRGNASSTSSGFQVADRWEMYMNGNNANFTQSLSDVAAGTTPYELGFRKAFKVLNAGQSGPDTGDTIRFQQKVEDKNIATSGWNYKSASSYLTCSFWAKASVAQSYLFNILARSDEGSASDIRNFSSTFALSANTWTKVTVKIPGSSVLTFDNDTGRGLDIAIWPFMGTFNTTSGHTVDTWATYSSSDLAPDMTSTWWTTSNATFEITGFQLEVGDVATDFEHRSYGDELARCQRYYYLHAHGATADSNSNAPVANAANYNSTVSFGVVHFPVTMRSFPTIDAVVGTSYFRLYSDGGADPFDNVSLQQSSPQSYILRFDGNLSGTAGYASWVQTNNSAAKVAFQAEL